VAAFPQNVDPIQPDLRPLPRVPDPGLEALAARAGGQKGLRKTRAGRQSCVKFDDGNRVRVHVCDDQALAGGVCSQLKVNAQQGQAGSAPLMRLQEGQAGRGPDVDPKARRVGPVPSGDMPQDQRPCLPLANADLLGTRAIGDNEDLPRQPVKRTRTDCVGRQGLRRLREGSQQPAQVRPAPVLIPSGGQARGVAKPDGLIQVHAALAYLS